VKKNWRLRKLRRIISGNGEKERYRKRAGEINKRNITLRKEFVIQNKVNL
jgi:hypothetical protein